MPRRKPLHYLPSSFNHGANVEKDYDDSWAVHDELRLSQRNADSYSIDQDDTMTLRDTIILNMLSGLRTDRERIILLLQIMRGDGYNFDQDSIARFLGVDRRWYFRMLKKVKERLAAFNPNL